MKKNLLHHIRYYTKYKKAIVHLYSIMDTLMVGDVMLWSDAEAIIGGAKRKEHPHYPTL